MLIAAVTFILVCVIGSLAGCSEYYRSETRKQERVISDLEQQAEAAMNALAAEWTSKIGRAVRVRNDFAAQWERWAEVEGLGLNLAVAGLAATPGFGGLALAVRKIHSDRQKNKLTLTSVAEAFEQGKAADEHFANHFQGTVGSILKAAMPAEMQEAVREVKQRRAVSA